MRKLIVLLLICVAISACQKNESRDDQSTLTTLDTAATAADTARVPATDTAAPAPVEAEPSAIVMTQTAPPFDFPPPPEETPRARPRYDYIVDTYYEWPEEVERVVRRRAPGAHHFSARNADKIAAKRKKNGYEVWGEPVPVRGVVTSPPSPFHFPRTVVVYRKRVV